MELHSDFPGFRETGEKVIQSCNCNSYYRVAMPNKFEIKVYADGIWDLLLLSI